MHRWHPEARRASLERQALDGRAFPRWRWGRIVDGPSTTSTPQLFSPSDLEPERRRESSAYGSFDELRERFKR